MSVSLLDRIKRQRDVIARERAADHTDCTHEDHAREFVRILELADELQQARREPWPRDQRSDEAERVWRALVQKGRAGG